MSKRFTIDGSPALESGLRDICENVRGRVIHCMPANTVAAIVLGGGYGRGEGGVLKTETGDAPYNDLEYYVFVKKNRLWHDATRSPVLHHLGETMSKEASLQIEFKIDCIERWKKGPPSMFSYDLVARHKNIYGDSNLFEDSSAHLDAAAIPLSEATRLMFNRCSGLLLSRALLTKSELSIEDADFIERNIAKMQLALGDAALTGFGQYHWSARERHRRLKTLAAAPFLPWWKDVLNEHAVGLKFKLRPRYATKSADELMAEHRRVTKLALQLWLWLERLRLQQPFASAAEYALSAVNKCPEMPAWRNCLVNLRSFGPKTLLNGAAWQYPRARLFNVLALLLWDDEELANFPFLQRVQEDLRSNAPDWLGLVGAFKQMCTRYG